MTDSDSQEFTQSSEHPEIEYVVRESPRKRSLAGRIGFGALLIVWFSVLSLPLVFFVLAIQGDITIRHTGDVPDKHQHPRFQVTLIMDVDNRGLQFTNSAINRADDLNLCIDTQVNYALWQGNGDSARYCDCYTRDASDDDWQFIESTQGACP